MTDAKKVYTGKSLAIAYITGGLTSIAMGLIMYYFIQLPHGQSIGFQGAGLLIGLILICIGLYSYVKGRDRLVYDERSMRIFAQAGNITWFLSWILLGALASLATLGMLYVSFELILWVVWMAMPWVFLAPRFVISRRGEVA